METLGIQVMETHKNTGLHCTEKENRSIRLADRDLLIPESDFCEMISILNMRKFAVLFYSRMQSKFNLRS